jgi:hypothetical protein
MERWWPTCAPPAPTPIALPAIPVTLVRVQTIAGTQYDSSGINKLIFKSYTLFHTIYSAIFSRHQAPE